jgi:hypothetical protein
VVVGFVAPMVLRIVPAGAGPLMRGVAGKAGSTVFKHTIVRLRGAAPTGSTLNGRAIIAAAATSQHFLSSIVNHPFGSA